MKEDFEGRGLGRELVSEVEKQLESWNAHLLIVETSQLPEFATARASSERIGFKFEAEIENFFDEGDNKLIFTKPMSRIQRGIALDDPTNSASCDR